MSLFCYTFSVAYTLWIVYTHIYDYLSVYLSIYLSIYLYVYLLQEETDTQRTIM